MSYQVHLVLFVALLCKSVHNQGFGGYNNLKDSTTFDTGGSAGKRSPLQKQDGRSSPQHSLRQRIDSTKSPSFSEDLPDGRLAFGDTILSTNQYQRLFRRGRSDVIRRFDAGVLWKDAVVPYSIHCSLDKLKDAVTAIKSAMKEWESKTCLKFVERTKEKVYLRFYRDTQCWVHDGLQSTHTTISVGFGCEKTNIMGHLIGHAIGLYHQHNRNDRDSFVEIKTNKMMSEYEDAFTKVTNSYSKQLSYDFNSIMHFPWISFSRSGSKTLVPKQRRGRSGQPYRKISVNDVNQVKSMYNCDAIRRKREEIAEKARSTVRARSWAQAPNNDEYEVFTAVQSSPGEAGCVDWSNVNHCRDWKIAGYCETQESVKQYCKKTCNVDICKAKGESKCSGEDKHPKCHLFERFCASPSYKDWMMENCCNMCTRILTPKKSNCTDRPGDFCATYVGRGYCVNSRNFREKYCCKTCKERSICRSNPNVCGRGKCKDTGDYKHTCECDQGTVAVEGGKRCEVDRCGGCDKENGECVNIGGRYECQCKQGFILQNDKKTCSDVDECASNVNICGLGTCANRRGSFKCYCNVAATLVDGGKRCVAKTTCKTKPSSQVTPLNPEYPANLGTGRLCGYTKDKTAGDCDQGGLEPKGLCTRPLGLSLAADRSNRLADSAFKSSRGHLVLNEQGKQWTARPSNARLYFEDNYRNGQIGGWCAPTGVSSMQKLQYLRVDLGKKKRITHIATQGRDKYFERVSQFKIEYSDTGNDDDFCPYLENGKEKIFDGNCDHVTPVVNQFFEPLVARFVRFIPWKYNYPCVRMELYGCDEDELQPDP